VNFLFSFIVFDFFLFILTDSFLLGTISATLTIPGEIMTTSPSRDKGKLVFCNFFMLFSTLLTILFPYSEQYSSHIPIKNRRERNFSKVFLDIFFFKKTYYYIRSICP